MKYFGPEGARLVAFFAPEEIRGTTYYAPDFMRDVQERYDFQVRPDVIEALEKNSMTFRAGRHHVAEGITNIQEFTLLQSAAVVEALSSDTCETFLQDVLEWGQYTYGWRQPTSPIRRRYVSACVIEFDKRVEEMFGKLDQACRIVSEALRDEYSMDFPYYLRSISLGCDPLHYPENAVTPEFSIQRRSDFPYEGNRFYCTGPLPSEKLKDVLEGIERLLLS